VIVVVMVGRMQVPSIDGSTPMWIASYKNNVEALQWLFDHGAQEDVRTPRNDAVLLLVFCINVTS